MIKKLKGATAGGKLISSNEVKQFRRGGSSVLEKRKKQRQKKSRFQTTPPGDALPREPIFPPDPKCPSEEECDPAPGDVDEDVWGDCDCHWCGIGYTCACSFLCGCSNQSQGPLAGPGCCGCVWNGEYCSTIEGGGGAPHWENTSCHCEWCVHYCNWINTLPDPSYLCSLNLFTCCDWQGVPSKEVPSILSTFDVCDFTDGCDGPPDGCCGWGPPPCSLHGNPACFV